MINITEHFILDEFTRSDTAEKLGIINNPQGIHIENMQRLCVNVLEPLREHFVKPVNIKSGYRCPALNEAVKGSKNSQHMEGMAADIEIPGVDNADIWNWIDENLEFDQLIAERLREDDGSAGWIHISYDHFGNRVQAMSCLEQGEYRDGLWFMEDL